MLSQAKHSHRHSVNANFKIAFFAQKEAVGRPTSIEKWVLSILCIVYWVLCIEYGILSIEYWASNLKAIQCATKRFYISFTMKHLRIASNFSASNEIEVLAGLPLTALYPLIPTHPLTGLCPLSISWQGSESQSTRNTFTHFRLCAFYEISHASFHGHETGVLASGGLSMRAACYAHICSFFFIPRQYSY